MSHQPLCLVVTCLILDHQQCTYCQFNKLSQNKETKPPIRAHMSHAGFGFPYLPQSQGNFFFFIDSYMNGPVFDV